MDNQQENQQSKKPVRVKLLRQLWVVLFSGAILATLFTTWTPLGLIPFGLGESFGEVFSPGEGISGQFLPTPTPRPRPLIGIVAGHYQYDTGAVCEDGTNLREVDINFSIADRVKANLIREGFDVDLLGEMDDRLFQYQALVLVSIHADSCVFINNEATGFKVAAALATAHSDNADRLVACLTSRYMEITGLNFHAGSVTEDMRSYHAFDEIHNQTTAAIIEVGFMNLDRQLLTQNPDLVAEGITQGILCYIRNEDASMPEN